MNKEVGREDEDRRLAADKQYRMAEFLAGLDDSVRGLVRAAKALRAMEEAGDEIPKIDRRLLLYLRRLGQGMALPELMDRVGFDRELLAKVAGYSLKDQQELVQSTALKVVVPTQDGRLDAHRMIDVIDMEKDHLAQVFGRTGIRDEAEQRSWLEAKRVREWKKRKPGEEAVGYRVDRARRMIRTTGPMDLDERMLAQMMMEIAR